MHPARQQQPALALHHLPRCASFAKELRPPHFIHRRSCVLHDMEFVIYDPAPRYPLFQALPVRLPHVHTGRPDRAALEAAQLLLQELVQGFLLPQMNLVHSHLPQGRFPSCRRPALQIPQIDGAHCAGRQPKLLRHPPHRCTLASQPYRLFEPLAERRLAGQLHYLLRFDPAVRAAHPIQLNYHRRPILRPGQIAHLPLIDVAGFSQLPPAAGTHQLPVPTLAPHPQLQGLARLIDFMPVYAVAWPPQQFGPVVLSHPAECTQSSPKSKSPIKPGAVQIPAQNLISKPTLYPEPLRFGMHGISFRRSSSKVMKHSQVFYTNQYKALEEAILGLLNSQADFMTTRTAGSTRAAGDAIQDIICSGFQAILGNLCSEYSSEFARRAMADLAFKDREGLYYVVDVKTHRTGTAFNMPNLTSVERLARFYEDDSNYFVLLVLHNNLTKGAF